MVVVPPGNGTDGGIDYGDGGIWTNQGGAPNSEGGLQESSHVTGGDSGGRGCRIGERDPGRSGGTPLVLLAAIGLVGLRRRQH